MESVFDDDTLERYSDLLLWALEVSRGGKFKKSDIVLLDFDPLAMPLAEALFSRLHDKGMNPLPRQGLTARMELDFYSKANNKRLRFRPPGERRLYEGISGEIRILAPESLTHLAAVDPESVARADSARASARAILARRQHAGEFGRTVCLYPTPALAEASGMTLEEYAQRVSRACWLGSDSPVREWRRFLAQARTVLDWLNSLRVREFHVEAASIDLRVTPGKKRRWLGVTGGNIPSFELYLSPNWRGTNGSFAANVTSWRYGHKVAGARLAFRQGELVGADAEAGGDFLRDQILLDRGSNKIGELSLTDRRFSRIDRPMAHALYDENIGGDYGNCHIALGAAHPESYSGNPAMLSDDLADLLGLNRSDLHWDLVNTEDKRITALLEDGSKRTIYEHGEFAL